MSDPRRRTCTCCGKHSDEVGPISWQGNCLACGKLLQEENIVGIVTRTGYAHKRRLRGYARWLQKSMLDEQRAAP